MRSGDNFLPSCFQTAIHSIRTGLTIWSDTSNQSSVRHNLHFAICIKAFKAFQFYPRILHTPIIISNSKERNIRYHRRHVASSIAHLDRSALPPYFLFPPKQTRSCFSCTKNFYLRWSERFQSELVAYFFSSAALQALIPV